MADLADLTYAECRAALETVPVGRVAVCTRDGPEIVPVNYTLLDESVVFRTSPFSMLAANVPDALVAFEVDHLDEASHRGWSVLARGRAHVIEDPEELQRVQRLAPPSPWAPGSRNLYVRLPWKALTGRRVG